jgi:hypothetical protein
MRIGVIRFNIEPKGIHTAIVQIIEMLQGKPVTIGFDQHPKACMLMD